MQLTSPQSTNGLSPVSWRFVWIGLALLLASWPMTALSQSPFPADPYAGPPPSELPFGEPLSGRTGQAFGGVVRGGFVTGPGVGREDGFAPLEFMPYAFINDGLIFGDMRGFRSVKDGFGFNVGTGYRHYIRKWDRIIGANFYYDYDNTSGQLFRQSGFGLETLGPLWDMRVNAYFPVTETRKEISISDPFNLRFDANNILFDRIRTFGTHMKGLDHEISVPLPGRLPEKHNLRLAAGWYHFQQDEVPSAWGWKGRLEGDLIDNVHLGLEVTNDKVFDTNVVFSVAMSYGGFRQEPGRRVNQFDRMTDPVKRQYTAVVYRDPELEAGLVATKSDGTPILVEHVASETPYNRANLALMRSFNPSYDPAAPLGTFENPYLTIADAQDPGTMLSDITFVWTNSVFENTTVVTESGVRLLGEADNAPHLVNINGVDVLLPRAVNSPEPDPLDPFDTRTFDQKPLFVFTDRGTQVDAVTLTSRLVLPGSEIRRTEFSGFRVGDANDADSGSTGHGIFAGPGVTGVDVRFTEVNYAVDDGIHLDSVGQIVFAGTRIFNAGANGLNVDGGVPLVAFGRAPNTVLTYDGNPIDAVEIEHDGINPATGAAVRISGIGSGGLVNLAPLTNQQFFARINYNSAQGVFIENSEGGARFGWTRINEAPNQAIQIYDSSGRYVFLDSQGIADDVAITTPFGNAIDIQGLAEGGEVSFFGRVRIDDRRSGGLALGNRVDGLGVPTGGNSGNILFNGGVDILAGLPFPSATAIDYQFSSGNVSFANITGGGSTLNINGGSGVGIQIGRDDGDALEVPGNTLYNNSGIFSIAGQTNISNMGGISLNIVRDDSIFRYTGLAGGGNQNFTISNRGDTGINIDRQRGAVSFTDSQRTIATVVNAATNVNANPAVRIQGTPYVAPVGSPIGIIANLTDTFNETNGSVAFDNLTVNGANSPNRFTNSGVWISDMQAPVTFGELNITSTIGNALVIERTGNIDPDNIVLEDANGNSPNGLVRTRSGTIQATGSSAIIATDSRINLNLSSVTATNALNEGIFLANNRISSPRLTPFTLAVGGQQTIAAPGTNGNIVNAGDDGVFLSNTGAVSLNGMSIRNNGGQGIFAINADVDTTYLTASTLPTGVTVAGGSRTLNANGSVTQDPLFTEEISIINTEVLSNADQGLLAIDIPNINLVRSQFEVNGQGPESEIHIVATREMPNRTGVAGPLGFADFNVYMEDVYARENGASDAFIVDAVLIETAGNVIGNPLLNLEMVGTDYNNVRGGEIVLQTAGGNTNEDAGLRVRWNGPIDMSSRGYIYRTERALSNGVIVQQLDRDAFMRLDFSSNVIIVGTGGSGVQGQNANGLHLIIDGQAGTGFGNDFRVNDNYVFLNNSATGPDTRGMRMVFNNTAFLTLAGTNDDQDPSGLIPDPDNDFGDNAIEYEIGPVGSGNFVSAEGPFGNIVLMHANNVTAIEMTFNAFGQATIENNVIANEPGVLNFLQRGFVVNFNSELSLFGSLNNGVLIDFPFAGANGLQNEGGSVAPWITFNGNTANVQGGFFVNGDLVPSGP